MDDWLHNLPVMWMAVVVFAMVYLGTGGIFAIIMFLGRGKWARVFKGASPGLLSPLGTIFGLLVVFTFFKSGATSIAPGWRSIAKQARSGQ